MNNFNIKKHIRTNCGFTLVEAIITLAIMSILSVSVVTLYPKDNYKVKKVARGISSDIQMTKMSAIRQNTTHAILFGGNGYTIYSASGDGDWTTVGDNTTLKTVNFTFSDTGIAYDTAVPNAFGTTPADGISYTNNVLTLNSRGLSKVGYVYLNFNNFRYAIGTPLITGIVRIRRYDGTAWR